MENQIKWRKYRIIHGVYLNNANVNANDIEMVSQHLLQCSVFNIICANQWCVCACLFVCMCVCGYVRESALNKKNPVFTT